MATDAVVDENGTFLLIMGPVRAGVRPSKYGGHRHHDARLAAMIDPSSASARPA
jgi:hypothetical protein